MKRICLCVKIHIPMIFRNFRFNEINQNDDYYDDHGLDYHVSKICTDNLHPFFKTVKAIFRESGGRFKVAVSISGSTLKLLQKTAPQTILMLSELVQEGCIEFLSEPWSHSIIAFSNSETLLRQTNQHDELIHAVFGKVPEVLIIHSPICPEKVWRTVQQGEGKGVFMYSNHIERSKKAKGTKDRPAISNVGIHPVHRTLSQEFQKLVLGTDIQLLKNFTSGILQNMKNDSSPTNCLVLVYDLAVFTKPFNKNTAFLLKATINELLADECFQFCFPSETKTCLNTVFSDTISNNDTDHFLLPVDSWLKNELQKRTYAVQLSVQKRIQSCCNTALHKKWDLIQDMDNLYFMNSDFFSEDYYMDNYCPYTSPYMAFTNYMNILDDLAGRVEN